MPFAPIRWPLLLRIGVLAVVVGLVLAAAGAPQIGGSIAGAAALLAALAFGHRQEHRL
jgi:hypothetical protein